MSRLLEVGGKRLPFLRWSFLRMVLGMKQLTTEWQVGDGREQALEEYVLAAAAPNDLDLERGDRAAVPDLARIVQKGWLHAGSVVVADNIKMPGVPGYREFMREHEGRDWRTVEHETHVEYQTLMKDLVLESEYLRGR